MDFAALLSILSDTLAYLRALLFYARGGKYAECDVFSKYDESTRCSAYVFSLALAMRMWDSPHYRKSTYSADVRDNFANVAVPGTGLALSCLAVNRYVTAVFLVFLYPLVCLVAGAAHAVRAARGAQEAWTLAAVAKCYKTQLLAPQDWFSLWRINSRLAAWHSLSTRDEVRGPLITDGWHDYGMENKWAFIEKGLALGVAVSPVLKLPALCIKHKNEEGGMGIYFYRNALEGGDWIIQEVMKNEDFVASLLSEKAPLSTFRVMTASWCGMPEDAPERPAGAKDVDAISCVFRAGREGASTDHSSILFDVDVATGKVGRGTTNMQWYQLGLQNAAPIGNVRWAPPEDVLLHPDTNRAVTGAVVPEFAKRVLELATDAHRKMLPRVPIAGWDVVLSQDHGACLLEVNLSCNFFRGSFDEVRYVDFIDRYFRYCERISSK